MPELTARVAEGIAPGGAADAADRGYWTPGDVINWHYRRPGACQGDAPVQRQRVFPHRVVRDDERGLVAWLAPGTTGIAPARTDGRPVIRGRDVCFDYPWRMERCPWLGEGCLRIAPTGMPWSIWLFSRPEWEFIDWYVNLEDSHLRDEDGIYTCDHVLDIVVKPTGECVRKDEDELQAALEQGRFTAEQVRAIEANAAAAESYVSRHPWPFDAEWRNWRPDPKWRVPQLPASLTANLGAGMR